MLERDTGPYAENPVKDGPESVVEEQFSPANLVNDGLDTLFQELVADDAIRFVRDGRRSARRAGTCCSRPGNSGGAHRSAASSDDNQGRCRKEAEEIPAVHLGCPSRMILLYSFSTGSLRHERFRFNRQ